MMKDIEIQEIFSKGLKKQYEISISASALEEALNSELQDKIANTVISGFRKGKAPLSMVKKMTDIDEMLYKIVANRSFNSLMDMFKESNQKLFDNPKITSLDVSKYKESNLPATCVIEVELEAEVPTLDPATIDLASYEVEIGNEDVEEEIKAIIKNESRYVEELSPEYAAQKGDISYIDFAGYRDDKAFKGGTAKDFKVVIGEGRLVPAMEDALVGMRLAQEKEVAVTFDNDYHDKNLAGKNAIFQVELKKLTRKLPISSKEEVIEYLKCKDEDGLNTHLKNAMENSIKMKVRNMLSRELADKLNEKYSVEIPESILDKERDRIREYCEKNEGSNLDTLLLNVERRLKLGMLFAKFAETNDIKVTQEDVKNRVLSTVYGNEEYATHLLELLSKTPEMFRNMSADILEGKILDKVLEITSKTVNKVTHKEFKEIYNNSTKPV